MHSMSEPRELAAKVLAAEARAVTLVTEQLGESFDAAVERICGCAGTVILGGIGKSGIIARKISATLASTGTPSHFLHPAEAVHGDIGRIRVDDVVILLSYGGNTDEVLALAALLRTDNVPVIAICGQPDCHLAKLAELTLCIGDVTEACPHNLAPTASTTAMLALGDALAMAVAQRRNFSANDFAKRHPGGVLGRQMMAVTDIMRFRSGENLPLVPAIGTVGDALSRAADAIDAARGVRPAGAVLLVDDHDTLVGIFTDADLRRLILAEGSAGLDRPITEVMTRSPKSLRSDAVVRDAVQMVRELRVDELPVIDDAGRPLGLIDVQDLIALKVIEE